MQNNIKKNINEQIKNKEKKYREFAFKDGKSA